MNKTILLADDSPTIRRIVELSFDESSIHVEAVDNGLEALEKLHEVQPDLLLADVIMPEPNGYELCRQVKQSGRPIPVVLLTGAFEEFDGDRARRSGADDRLVKPFESQMLRDTVDRLLEASPVPPGVRQTALAPEDALELDALSAEVEQSRPGSASSDPRRETLAVGNLPETAAEPPNDGNAAAADEDFYEVSTEWEFDEVPRALPVETAAGAGDEPRGRLSRADIEAVADAVVRRLSGDVVRDLAREMLPDIATELVRQRIRELEGDDS